jgi:hypothetical protein
MEKALHFDGKEVFAYSADCGYYLCPECGELVYLRRPKDNEPYFYHNKYNEKCSFSIKSNSTWISYKTLIKEAINILKTDYRKRWIEAINVLIKYDSLNLLENKDWAINPIRLYIDSNINNLNKETFYQLLTLLVNFNDEKLYNMLFKLLDLNILNNNERNILLKKYFVKISSTTKDLFDFIINTDNIEKRLVFQFIYKKMGHFEHQKLLKNNKYENLVFLTQILINYKKDHDEMHLFNEYNRINNSYRKSWSKDESLYFNILLKEELIKMNIHFKNNIIKDIEDNILKLKYYVD